MNKQLNELETDLQRKEQTIKELENKILEQHGVSFHSNKLILFLFFFQSSHGYIEQLNTQISELQRKLEENSQINESLRNENDHMKSVHLSEMKELTAKLHTMELEVIEKQRFEENNKSVRFYNHIFILLALLGDRQFC